MQHPHSHERAFALPRVEAVIVNRTANGCYPGLAGAMESYA